MIHVQFIKSGSPYGFGYSAGATGVILDEKQAKELESLGVLKIIPPPCELPENLPGRDKLIKAGFNTIEELKNISDITEVEGIGKQLASKIAAYIA